jgi:acetylornithine deacetylase
MNVVALAAALIEFDSRNPSLVPGAPGERRVVQFLGDVLDRWGFSVQLVEVIEGRSNLIARAGKPNSRSIMLNGHLDVVGTEGMVHQPFLPTQTGGRLYGRGSADMKGGVSAMCIAAHQAVEQGLHGEVILTAVIDEEYGSLGTKALIASGVRADAVIITEPTRLAICPAHRGFVWAELAVRGRAAHGSRYDIGIDAISHAGLILAELDRIQREQLPSRVHPLLGHASMHASTISGGTGYSTYPGSCHVTLERRTIPGETPETFQNEIEQACRAVRTIHPDLETCVTITMAQASSDVASDAPIVQTLSGALRAEGQPVNIEGMSAWTDAALFNEARIPAICFGPGDITLAHAATEYVPVQELEDATRVLQRTIIDWCNI